MTAPEKTTALTGRHRTLPRCGGPANARPVPPQDRRAHMILTRGLGNPGGTLIAGGLGGTPAAGASRAQVQRARCLWCGLGFTPREGGGSPQRFCALACRWAERALATGRLTVAEIKAGGGTP